MCRRGDRRRAVAYAQIAEAITSSSEMMASACTADPERGISGFSGFSGLLGLPGSSGSSGSATALMVTVTWALMHRGRKCAIAYLLPHSHWHCHAGSSIRHSGRTGRVCVRKVIIRRVAHGGDGDVLTHGFEGFLLPNRLHCALDLIVQRLQLVTIHHKTVISDAVQLRSRQGQ